MLSGQAPGGTRLRGRRAPLMAFGRSGELRRDEDRETALGVEAVEGEQAGPDASAQASSRRLDRPGVGRLELQQGLGGGRAAESLIRAEEDVVREGQAEPVFEVGHGERKRQVAKACGVLE